MRLSIPDDALALALSIRNLMAREDLKKLGFRRQIEDEASPGDKAAQPAKAKPTRSRAKEGFVSGVRGK